MPSRALPEPVFRVDSVASFMTRRDNRAMMSPTTKNIRTTGRRCLPLPGLPHSASHVVLRVTIGVLLLLITCIPFRAVASHLYGADLFYTHIAGNTYRISLIAYGDCKGGAFFGLPISAPVVEVYNGATRIDTFFLQLQATTKPGTATCSSSVDPAAGHHLLLNLPSPSRIRTGASGSGSGNPGVRWYCARARSAAARPSCTRGSA